MEILTIHLSSITSILSIFGPFVIIFTLELGLNLIRFQLCVHRVGASKRSNRDCCIIHAMITLFSQTRVRPCFTHNA